MNAPDTLVDGTLLGEVPRLRRYARVLTCNLEQADRLVLETLDCARRKHRPGKQRSLRTWLFSIMHNLHREPSVYRSPGLSPAVEGIQAPAGSLSVAARAAVPSGAETNRILADLSRLPVEQREVLVLVAVERLGYAEIASVLGVPIGTLLARLNCAREAMRS